MKVPVIRRMPSRKLVYQGGHIRVTKMASVEYRCQIHQNNINRYERLLKTYLTDIERNFIELRLWEEQVALRQDQSKGIVESPRLTPGTSGTPMMLARTGSD